MEPGRPHNGDSSHGLVSAAAPILVSKVESAAGTPLGQFLDDARLYRLMDARQGTFRSRSLIMTILRSRGLWILQCHRLGHYAKCNRNSRALGWWFARLSQPIGAYLAAVGGKSEILAECQIGRDVYLSNQGHIICAAQEIGEESFIHDHCTLGESIGDGQGGRPIIGRKVWIGSNCVIAGSVTVGDGATILPGTFLTFSVRPGALVAGNPARVIAEAFDNAAMRSSSRTTYDVIR